MYSIRPYSDTDYPTIKEWWDMAKQSAPTKDMHPAETTFILEVKDKPAVCISVILTNCKEMAYLENFIADPSLKDKKKATSKLLEAAFSFIKALGYKRAVGFTNVEKLVERYKEMGFQPYPNNYFMSREV